MAKQGAGDKQATAHKRQATAGQQGNAHAATTATAAAGAWFHQGLAALRAQELAIRGDLQILLGTGEGTVEIVGAAAGAHGHG
jgi:hypothetical protein